MTLIACLFGPRFFLRLRGGLYFLSEGFLGRISETRVCAFARTPTPRIRAYFPQPIPDENR